MIARLSIEDKRAVADWDIFVEEQNRDAPVDLNESPREKQKRIAALEKDDEAWFKYYFPKFYSSEPAPFHLRSTKRVMSNPEFYEVRPWSRELAKSGRTMMEVLKLTLTGKKRNVILCSANKDAAINLLNPYKVMLESNNRIIHDYGTQAGSPWKEGIFRTRKGVQFIAIGKGQSPRGSRNEEVRPDVLLVDDFDTDEDVRNPDTIDKFWSWFEKAFYATRSISNPLLLIWCGNIIAEYCSTLKAMELADAYEVVNIRDEHGISTWPEKNKEEMIDRVLSKISYAAQQGEYFNNPISQGKVFPELHYKKMQPIKNYQFLVAYTDPSYKAGKKNDFKATALVGKWKDEYHVIKTYCAQTTTADMLDWQYEIIKMVRGRVPVFFLIEWPSIDDTLKLEIKKANARHGITLPLRADERVKPEKFYRIESLLEPLNRNEKLWFNEDLKVSEHQKAMEAQFMALSPTSRAHDDGPDAVEGAVFVINDKTINDVGKVESVRNYMNKANNKRW